MTAPVLVPLPRERFPAFVEAAITSYAQQNIASGRWPAETALELSRAEHRKLMPEGIDTVGHHIFEIHDPANGGVVGTVWLGVQGTTGTPFAYVFNIEVAEAHRRRGHAKRAFAALEPIVRGLGLSSIGLHVFAFNTGAQALYASLGYEVTGINMRKTLGAAT